MPYINLERRVELLDDPGSVNNSGELNYLITELCLDYIERKGKKYAHMNDVIGALEGAKLEFYRRLVAPYEDDKAEENGDVYPVHKAT